jgi:hypothetical protein
MPEMQGEFAAKRRKAQESFAPKGTEATEEKSAAPPYPSVFGKRGGKLLKTKEANTKKRGKREQEAASK